MSEAITINGLPKTSKRDGFAAQAVRVWLRVALLSFGGPAGQIGVMHRILVREALDFGNAFSCMLSTIACCCPALKRSNIATYIGWLMHRTLGGIPGPATFVLPNYRHYGAELHLRRLGTCRRRRPP